MWLVLSNAWPPLPHISTLTTFNKIDSVLLKQGRAFLKHTSVLLIIRLLLLLSVVEVLSSLIFIEQTTIELGLKLLPATGKARFKLLQKYQNFILTEIMPQK
jgi:hypothetical protein